MNQPCGLYASYDFNLDPLKEGDETMYAYPSDQVQAEMPFNVPPEIFWESPDNALLIYTSSLQPFILIVAANPFSKFLRKPAMVHPLLRVTPFYSHLLKTNRERLKIGLYNVH